MCHNMGLNVALCFCSTRLNLKALICCVLFICWRELCGWYKIPMEVCIMDSVYKELMFLSALINEDE